MLVNGNRIYLIKVSNPESKGISVFATNLPPRLRSPSQIADLYMLRWEVETSFKELTAITKTEQWHSKSYNGILQELYTQFWLINFTKSLMLQAGQKPLSPEKRTYKKGNFKLCYQFIVTYIGQCVDRISYIKAYLSKLLIQSTERRRRMSRSYPRVIKSPASPYTYDNTNWYWERV